MFNGLFYPKNIENTSNQKTLTIYNYKHLYTNKQN